jgi:hypothetical protein
MSLAGTLPPNPQFPPEKGIVGSQSKKLFKNRVHPVSSDEAQTISAHFFSSQDQNFQHSCTFENERRQRIPLGNRAQLTCESSRASEEGRDTGGPSPWSGRNSQGRIGWCRVLGRVSGCWVLRGVSRCWVLRGVSRCRVLGGVGRCWVLWGVSGCWVLGGVSGC